MQDSLILKVNAMQGQEHSFLHMTKYLIATLLIIKAN
jgi:hypothetical protein